VLALGGCTSDDVIQVASAALTVAGAVAGAQGGGYVASPPPRRYVSSGASVGGGASVQRTVGPATGYSQRGAFEDCQRMYQAAGRYDLARQCAGLATNMGSLN
jgi:hypothetical protein